MQTQLTEYPLWLLETAEKPCVSLYQPTHRHHPDNKQDPIRFRNQLKEVEEALGEKYPEADAELLLKPLSGLARDEHFWNHTLDGLAVLRSPSVFQVYRTQRPVPKLAVVSGSFHTKPLMRIAQSADRYQVLGLSRKEIRLFEGNRDVLDELEPAEGVPRTITEALGEELSDPHLTVSSYGGAGGAGMHHGHGGRKDEVELDADRFFRAVDRAVLERHSKPSGLPLLLAALPEHHTLFRRISDNPFLLEGAVDTYPDAVDMKELRERAWRAVEPRYLARLQALCAEFEQARAKGLGTADLAEAARAAVAGQVATLLLEAARPVPGRMDAATGAVELDGKKLPGADDLLDEIGETALRMGGRVVVVPKERMPVDTGVAATYRY